MCADRRAAAWFLRDQRGAGAVEFALCLPVLAALVMGLFEFGWTQHCVSSIRYSVEGAARRLSLNPDASEAEIQAVVREGLEGLADPDVTVTVQILQGGPSGRMGVVSALYRREIGVPGVLAYPLEYTTRVETPLPAF